MNMRFQSFLIKALMISVTSILGLAACSNSNADKQDSVINKSATDAMNKANNAVKQSEEHNKKLENADK